MFSLYSGARLLHRYPALVPLGAHLTANKSNAENQEYSAIGKFRMDSRLMLLTCLTGLPCHRGESGAGLNTGAPHGALQSVM